MKTFVIGLPQSGRSRIAKALAEDPQLHYVSATDWLASTFRPPRPDERKEDYEQAYFEFYVGRLKADQDVVIDNILEAMSASDSNHFVIDGISNPADFTYLFNPELDVVVFLNRTDSEAPTKDYEGVSVNVMRDYALYLSLLGLLPRERWLEYNYKVPGEESDFVKQTGKHNSVFIIKSINKVIEHLRGELCKLLTAENVEE